MMSWREGPAECSLIQGLMLIKSCLPGQCQLRNCRHFRELVGGRFYPDPNKASPPWALPAAQLSPPS
eukprot:7335927-Pyramimonas_sp.AAC.1